MAALLAQHLVVEILAPVGVAVAATSSHCEAAVAAVVAAAAETYLECWQSREDGVLACEG